MTEQVVGRMGADGTAALIELLMEPSPATHIRHALKLYRERGYDFEQAWAQSLRSLPRTMPEVQEWREHLRQTKTTWRAAYLTPTEPLTRPLALVE